MTMFRVCVAPARAVTRALALTVALTVTLGVSAGVPAVAAVSSTTPSSGAVLSAGTPWRSVFDADVASEAPTPWWHLGRAGRWGVPLRSASGSDGAGAGGGAVSPAQVPAQVAQWRERVGDPASVLVVVNKRRALDPVDYVPAGLRGDSGVLLQAEASEAFLRLAEAAEAAGVPVRARSGYRSYLDQEATYRRWQRELGDAVADAQSARPGHSEHQTGLAVDVLPRGGDCQEYGCFADTPQAAWLAAHAAQFGFLVRYQPGQEPVTGYTAEPWHLRYVGVQAAAAVVASGARSIEEYLGLPAAPTY